MDFLFKQDSWEIVEGLRGAMNCTQEPQKQEGCLLKKRKWPLKGWHKVGNECVSESLMPLRVGLGVVLWQKRYLRAEKLFSKQMGDGIVIWFCLGNNFSALK